MPRTTYRVAFPLPHTHLVEIEASLAGVAEHGREIELRMAAWTPGSYLIREYARHVQDLSVVDETGRRLAVVKADKATWRVTLAGAKDVVVRYRVYAHDLTVRTNHVDATHAFLNGAPTFLWLAQRRREPVEVEIQAPPGWRVITALDEVQGDGAPRFLAADLDELLDSPIHAGAGPVLEFSAAGRPVRLAVWGQPDAGAVASLDDLAAETARILDEQGRLFGTVPYPGFTFFLLLTPGGYGGLEHRRSAALIASPFDFVARKQLEVLLELISHEHFHAWNVKRIRPRALAELTYDREAYTRALWVMEGVTSYYDRHMLRRAGLQSSKRYLEKLAEDWGKLLAIPGRARQSLEESSFDAWIKLYRPDENTANSTVSYYLKGSLVAACLDLEIRRRTAGQRSLDDVMRRLWERFGEPDRGFDDADVQAEMEAATGLTLGDFFARSVRGREDPDLAAALAAVGLELKASWTLDEQPLPEHAPAWLGALTRADHGRLRVTTVLAGGLAERSGLYAGDEILALDGFRVEDGALDRRLAARKPGSTVRVTVFRRDELRDVHVVLGERPKDRFEIVPSAKANDAQVALRRAWLVEPPGGDGSASGPPSGSAPSSATGPAATPGQGPVAGPASARGAAPSSG